MKARRALRRTRARGFTLMELMVVVVLIALLAAIAAPSMVRARSDRLTFDFARRSSEILHAARARAAGRGAAHIVLYSTDAVMGGNRGTLALFESLDGEPPPSGPNPQPSCRTANLSWVANWTPGNITDTAGRATFLEAVNLNDNGSGRSAQAQEDIRMAVSRISAVDGSSTAAPFFALCITPNGTTYLGVGSSATAAIATIGAQPFTDILAIDVARHSGSAVVGLRRRVLVAGAAQPRIRSE